MIGGRYDLNAGSAGAGGRQDYKCAEPNGLKWRSTASDYLEISQPADDLDLLKCLAGRA